MLDKLPDEILCQIVTELIPPLQGAVRIAVVCRKCLVACQVVLSKIEEADLRFTPSLSSKEAHDLFSITQNLKRLYLDCWRLSSGPEVKMPVFPKGLKELCLLGIDSAEQTDGLLETFSVNQAWPQLSRLQLCVFSPKMTAGGISAAVGLADDNLEVFALDGSPPLDAGAVTTQVAFSCGNLKDISTFDLKLENLHSVVFNLADGGKQLERLSNKSYTWDENCLSLNDESLQVVVDLFPCLHTLEIVNHIEPTVNAHAGNLTDFGLQEVSKLGDTLRVLRLANTRAAVSSCSPVALMQLVSSLALLEELHLFNFEHVSDSVVLELVAARGAEIKALTLDFSGVTNETLECIAAHCPVLTSVSVKGCTVQERGIRALLKADFCSLETLNAGNTAAVTDWALTPLRHPRAPPLKTLVLNRSPVTDEGLRSIALSPRSDCLREISLHQCGGVTDAGLQILAQSCRNLQCASLARTAVGDEGICALVKACRGITKLRLDHTNISDLTLETIGKYLHALRNLNIQSCPGLTGSGLSHMHPPALRSLRTLAVAGCRFSIQDSAQNDSLREVERLHPGLLVFTKPVNSSRQALVQAVV